MIMKFFNNLHEKLREIERQKMNELQEFFSKMPCEDVFKKADYLQRKHAQMHEYIKNLKSKYTMKKYTRIIERSNEIKDQMDMLNFHQQEIKQLEKDFETHK